MPHKFNLGDIMTRSDVGLRGAAYVMWVACVECGKERWVGLKRKGGAPISRRCLSCNGKYSRLNLKGERSPNWKGGRIITRDGYIAVALNQKDFFFSMAHKSKYVLEHRLVMAKYLGRCLHRWEIVHHRNRIKDDNSIENLQLVSDDRHKQISIMENRIRLLENRITILEAENILLKQEAII